MPLAIDNQQAALMALSAVNALPELGASDSIVSGNTTMAALIAAVLALPPVIGASPDANRKVATGLQYGVNSGAIPAAHGQTTIAGLAALISGQLIDVASSFQGFLPQ